MAGFYYKIGVYFYDGITVSTSGSIAEGDKDNVCKSIDCGGVKFNFHPTRPEKNIGEAYTAVHSSTSGSWLALHSNRPAGRGYDPASYKDELLLFLDINDFSRTQVWQLKEVIHLTV